MRNIKPSEIKALHECLSWARSGTNNKTLRMFSTIFESFHSAAGSLMSKIKAVLPEGSTKCRIRASSRESHQATTSTLLDSLGEEKTGMVFLDPSGIPLKYDQLRIYKEVVATCHSRIEVDAQGVLPNTWRKTGCVIDTANEPGLDESWQKDVSKGADHILQESWVSPCDPHMDAKIWPHLYRAQ